MPSVVLPSQDAATDQSAEAGPAPAVLELSVVDEDGGAHARDQTPLRPVVALRLTGALAGDPEPILLLRGQVDGPLLDDLEAPPLRVATRARVLAAHVERVPGGALIRPDELLEPGEAYLLAVGGWAGDGEQTLGLAFAVNLRAARHGGGARLVGSWPADGTEGVPGSIPFVAVHFDESVRGAPAGVRLLDEGGAEVPTRRRLVDCLELDWREGSCVRLEPVDPLWPGRPHRIELTESVVDQGGAPIGPAIIRFRVGVGPFSSPSLGAPTCALDETPWREDGSEDVPTEDMPALGCLLVDDRSLNLRLASTGPMRYRLEGGHGSARAVAPRGDASLALRDLEPDSSHELWLEATDLAGRTQRLPLHLHTTPALAPVYIMETRADPLGSEPRQEYVELLNAGATSVDLGGFSLADSPARPGDLLPSPAPLGPSERVLIVADAFDPEDANGAPIPAGARLIRVGTSLGSGGLSNSGEALFLRDALGRRLSGAPALPSAGGGVCLVRVVEDGRRMDADAFAFESPCTPGAGPLAR
ncbi:MAG: hypothetical protein GXP55_13125 [Deltaproteobacteria bacterium]|nr:hypothetical protein [Deltaproteobacteria bacterium]